MDHPSVSLSPHRSSLEDSSYSSGIDCPAVGMITPIESCESRLTTKNKKAACTVESCPRFRPTVATIKPPEKKRRSKASKNKHKCVCCSRIGVHQARGLITKCYDREKKQRNLGAFHLNYRKYVFTEEAT
jgi:hypothetical protein